MHGSLGVKYLKPTRMILQLVDKMCRYSHGIVEYVLAKVKDLIFLAEFYVVAMSNGKIQDSTLIFGRPILKIANTMIGMKEGSIMMKIRNQKFDLTYTKKNAISK